MGYNVINLKDICDAIGEKETKAILNNFQCYLNKDVEYFIREKAIEFSKQRIAETFIVTSSYKSENVIVGYFSLANKSVRIKKEKLSGQKRKRLARFAIDNDDSKWFTVSLPLIGQLGKNYCNGYNDLISGDTLLKMAFDKVYEAQRILGGRFVFLECEDKPKLKDFYTENGFVCFGKRNLERDERDKNAGEYLLQMLRDLSKYNT